MNSDQVAALKRLERAFKRCKEVGLCFYGMDDDLLAFDEKELKEVNQKYNNTHYHDGMRELDGGRAVETHGSYKDSGGW